MIRLFIAIAFMLVTPAHASPSSPLQEFQWKNRILLYFLLETGSSSESASAKQIEEQLDSFAAELHERDLLAAIVNSSETATLETINLNTKTLRKWARIQPKESTLILVGKDGEIKYRGPLTTPIADIFSRIDAMPMRQTEMKEKETKQKD